MNPFNKLQDYGYLANQMKNTKYPQTEIPKLNPNPNPLFDSKDNPLFPLEFGSDSTSLYFKAQQAMEKEKESPTKSVTSSNIGKFFTKNQSFKKTFIVYPEYLKNINYYHEFWLMYLQNEIIIAKMKEYVGEIKGIQKKIDQYEVRNLKEIRIFFKTCCFLYSSNTL